MADSKVNIVISAIDKASGPLGKITGSLGKFGTTALKGLAVGSAAVVGGLTAIGGAAIKLAVDAAPLEGIQNAFQGLAESAGASGDEVLAALQKASAGMVTNRDLMASFNQAAQLVSKDFAVALPEAMGYLGKVSAATGQDMGFMLDSLVKGVGRLSPMILDNLGIQVSLEEATANAAETFGVQAEELTKAQVQAGMMNVVLEKLKENTDAMPDVTGTAAQGFASLQATLSNAKDEIGMALLPIVSQLATALASFARDTLPLVIEWIQTSFIPAVTTMWEFISTNIIPLLQEYLPIAIQILSTAWETILLPAITAIWGFIKDFIIPILQEVIGWLGNNLPPVIQGLANVWRNVLQPALAVIWSFISGSLIPILQAVWDMIATVLPPVIQGLADLWTNVLKPAIELVWGFISNYLIPIFEAVVNLVGTVIVLAITALQGAWENVLLPALTKIWEFIDQKLIPIFMWLKDNVIAPVTKAIGEGLSRAIEWVIDKIDRLTSFLSNIKLPDWLTPGSPTPFELGLRGIADALQEINGMTTDVGFIPNGLKEIQKTSSVSSYTMNIHTNAQSSTLQQDFLYMQAMAG